LRWRKIHEYLDDFLVELTPTEVGKQSLNISVDGLNLCDTEAVLYEMGLDQSVEPVSHLCRGGASAAKGILESFIDNRFGDYVEHRAQPQTDDVLHMRSTCTTDTSRPFIWLWRQRKPEPGRTTSTRTSKSS
jgi:deoxyribodipyrimidine photo-lyase